MQGLQRFGPNGVARTIPVIPVIPLCRIKYEKMPVRSVRASRGTKTSLGVLPKLLFFPHDLVHCNFSDLSLKFQVPCRPLLAYVMFRA